MILSHYSKYQVTTQGLWWPELSGDLNVGSNLCCQPKDEKDTTAFSVRVFTTEGKHFL